MTQQLLVDMMNTEQAFVWQARAAEEPEEEFELVPLGPIKRRPPPSPSSDLFHHLIAVVPVRFGSPSLRTLLSHRPEEEKGCTKK